MIGKFMSEVFFPGIFDTTAQQAYMENTEAYEQLFLDAEKYRIIQQALAERLYRELHGDSKQRRCSMTITG